MDIPPELVIHQAICTGIAQVEGEPGVYVVSVLLDGVPEVFHIELDGVKVSFRVRERAFSRYRVRCRTLKGIVPLMREWHRGEHRALPVDLAEVDFV